jgi:hypothetical protein
MIGLDNEEFIDVRCEGHLLKLHQIRANKTARAILSPFQMKDFAPAFA